MVQRSRFPEFYKRTVAERIGLLVEGGVITEEDRERVTGRHA